MKTKFLVLTAVFVSSLVSCQFSSSIKKDLVSGLETRGQGITCEEVYLSDGEVKINRKSFTYGEKLYLNFSDIRGFEMENNAVFPGMELLIKDKKGNTVMHNPDLYANQVSGFEIDPLLLQSNITVANPIHSGNQYDLFIRIWDKKGKGSYEARMELTISPDENIILENTGIQHDEIYLFSSRSGKVITDGNVNSQEDIYFILEGLDGFESKEGKSRIQLNMVAKDSNGKVIVSRSELLSMETSKLETQITPYFKLPPSENSNPVNCEIIISDINGEGKIKVSAKLNVI